MCASECIYILCRLDSCDDVDTDADADADDGDGDNCVD